MLHEGKHVAANLEVADSDEEQAQELDVGARTELVTTALVIVGQSSAFEIRLIEHLDVRLLNMTGPSLI
ncbi:hypothetical protein GOBAR_AA25734 [Gossypium barbadense]|uniref:Uncharacterized protein n=1 Tax=Gossypium barbadense TaxID=3634 RepID=A0A2P5WV07_GOSBA|nr:hypothetical protein GOBAR_AA25734 [Gossypium barbadense]